MAKCGHDICPDDNCGWKYPFSKKRRERCRGIQGCIEASCNSLKAFQSGFALYDACIGHCHRDLTDPTNPDRYPNFEAYACANFDPFVLAENFGADICGIATDQTKIGKIQAEQDKLNAQQQKQLSAVFVVVLVLLAIFMLTRK